MANDRELSLTRLIDADPALVFRCFVEPDLLKQWFVPKPWTISKAEIDVRPGGKSLIVMRDPEGNEYPNPGVYLAIEPNRRIVTTDAFSEDWKPSEKAFMVADMRFEPEAGGTRYTATARHWTEEDLKTHEQMGFHEGWGQCADQLAELAVSLKAGG